jgi:hypothetical protein
MSTDFYPTPSGEVYVEAPVTKGQGGQLVRIPERQPGEDNEAKEFVEACLDYDLEEMDDHMLELGLDFNDYMNDVPLFSVGEKENAIFEFHAPTAWGIGSNGGVPRATDMHRVSAAPVLGDLEIWHLESGASMWSHNIHIHFEEGRILRRDGKPPPEWEKWARKDVYRLGKMDDSGSSLDIALRFREFAGTYMTHCHNTTHEDHAMLLRYDIENPGQVKPFLTPEPGWNGASYSESFEEKHASQRSESRGDALGKRDFDQNDIAAMLCPSGATDACPGAVSAGAVEEQSKDLCDADGNGQIDALDLLQMLRSPAVPGVSALAEWSSCTSKCTHRGCSPVSAGGGRCGLLGIESLLVLLPLALRRRAKSGAA